MTLIVVPFHLDEQLPGLPGGEAGRGGAVVVAPVLTAQTPPQRLVELHEQVAEAVAAAAVDAARPLVVVSGDCVASLGVLAGLQRAGVDPAAVWFDAHGDFNTPQTTDSGYLGGMPLAIAVGHDDLGIGAGLGLAALDESRAVLVDACRC